MSLLSTSLARLRRAAARYTAIGLRPGDAHEDGHRLRLANGTSLFVSVIILCFTFTDVFRTAWVEVASDALYLLLLQAPVLLNHLGRFRSARYTSIGIGFVCVGVQIMVMGTTDIGIMLIAPVAGVACLLLPPKEWPVLCGILAVSLGATLMLLDAKVAPLSGAVSADNVGLMRALGALTLFAIVTVLCWQANLETSKFVRDLAQSTAARQEALVRAQISSRLASIGELASGVAHEINNPLAIIQGNVDLIARMVKAETIDREGIFARIERIQATVQRAHGITAGMLTFARQPRQQELSPLNVTLLLATATALFQDLSAGTTLNLIGVSASKPIYVTGNGGWLQQILLNLLLNARDATSKTGSSLASRITVRVTEHGDAVTVDIEDSGHGIPPEHVDHVMEPFFTTKPVGSGTGLGLSVSKGLALAMGGDLHLISRARPTTFRLTLRRASEPAGAVKPSKPIDSAA